MLVFCFPLPLFSVGPRGGGQKGHKDLLVKLCGSCGAKRGKEEERSAARFMALQAGVQTSKVLILVGAGTVLLSLLSLLIVFLVDLYPCKFVET